MKAKFFRSQATVKIFLVLVLTLLAFQGSGINGLAAPQARSSAFQEGDAQPLTCGCSAYTIQTVFLIDDSGSMLVNDRASNRNRIANEIVARLVALQGDRVSQVKDVEVAVIHFSKDVIEKDGNNPALNLKPEMIKVAASSMDRLAKTINWQPATYDRSQTTNFIKPLVKSKELFTPGDCIRRSIVVFSDGTPEDETGRFTGTKLTEAFSRLSLESQGIPELDGVYLIGFKSNAKYLSDDVRTAWFDLIKNWSDFNAKLSTSQSKIPHLALYSSQELSNQWSLIDAAAVKKDKLDFGELSKYENLSVVFDSETGPLQQGRPGVIRFKLVDSTGQAVMPGGDTNKVLVPASASASLPEWKISIVPVSQQGPLDVGQEGGSYQFSWTPESSGLNRFQVDYALFDPQGDLLHCSGAVVLPVDPLAPLALSFVIMPPREPVEKNKSIVLPLQLDAEQNITEVQWDDDSPEVRTEAGKRIGATIEPAGTDTPGTKHREFNLIIDPAGDAGQLAVTVAGLAITDQGRIGIPKANSEIAIPDVLACTYDPAWNRMFWPLAVVLAGLLVALLAFRIKDGRTQKDYWQAQSDRLRIRKWRFLFVPLLVILAFLVLNRLWWCYIIPWPLFFAAMLGLIVAVFPLAYFIPREKPRAWVLLALLLVAAVLVVVVSITVDRRLLWPLAVLLLLTVIARWYIRPDERPETDGDGLAVFSLSGVPACMPFHESLTIPLQFEAREQAASLPWQFRAQVTPPGIANARIEPSSEGNGAYNLVIDPLAYRPDTRRFEVELRALVTQGEGLPVEVAGPTITIGLCPPDDLAELEGIGPAVRDYLYENQILTFKQLARTEVSALKALLDSKPWETTDARPMSQQVKPWKMMDAKTWPQQAKLAAIAREFGIEEDRLNYEAYKAWLKNGIEPDEYLLDEIERRDVALPWNGLPQFTPLALSLPLSPANGRRNGAIRLPVQLNHAGDPVRLEAVDWNASAQALPGGQEVAVTVQPVDAGQGRYEIAIDPVSSGGADEIRLTVQASVNGRSIEIYYGKALTVQVSPPPGADDLSDLEGIEAATEKILNAHGIFTFEQLADADHRTINTWLDEVGQKMRDAKTWPQQARLADIAQKYGREEDLRSYQAYKAWLKAGIEPDEYEKDEKDRRPVALAWPLAGGETPDLLEDLEGIGPAIAKMLNEYGMFSFKQLARADARQISAWLNECGYERVDPKTWPQQAKLASIAREFGVEEDLLSYTAYKAWLKGGIEPDEYDRAEHDRRAAALVWYGTAERTEAAYPAIFKA